MGPGGKSATIHGPLFIPPLLPACQAGSFPDASSHAHSLPLPSFPGSAIGAAVAATVCVPPGESVDVAFSLSWDVPIAKFNPNSSYLRYAAAQGASETLALAVRACLVLLEREAV